ncbi:hypothetical protein ACET3Z_007777 [Daucus carota]
MDDEGFHGVGYEIRVVPGGIELLSVVEFTNGNLKEESVFQFRKTFFVTSLISSLILLCARTNIDVF